MARRRSSHMQRVGGVREKFLQLASETDDPALQDLYLATGEARAAKTLDRRFGKGRTQDPRDVNLGEVALLPENDPAEEAYWRAGNLALTRGVSIEHGWPVTDPVGPLSMPPA